jgi:hypothetical protein
MLGCSTDFFYSEGRSDTFFRNVGSHTDYQAPYPRLLQLQESLLLELIIYLITLLSILHIWILITTKLLDFVHRPEA